VQEGGRTPSHLTIKVYLCRCQRQSDEAVSAAPALSEATATAAAAAAQLQQTSSTRFPNMAAAALLQTSGSFVLGVASSGIVQLSAGGVGGGAHRRQALLRQEMLRLSGGRSVSGCWRSHSPPSAPRRRVAMHAVCGDRTAPWGHCYL
jgi:hypothetical protein